MAPLVAENEHARLRHGVLERRGQAAAVPQVPRALQGDEVDSCDLGPKRREQAQRAVDRREVATELLERRVLLAHVVLANSNLPRAGRRRQQRANTMTLTIFSVCFSFQVAALRKIWSLLLHV